ncbi:MAG: CsgG/HfaB family protein [Sterolibacteriaceae bacterium MAG5]|nr:CsgG/HfaB family protein [Candidatus Nitricoxidireducens bremensis]
MSTRPLHIALRLPLVAAVSLMLAGCHPAMLMTRPTPPMPPKGEWQTVRDIIVTPVALDSRREPWLNVTSGQTVAIMNFKEQEGNGSGSLVADAFILDLQRKGHKVVDREHIEKLMKEQGLMAQGATKLTDIELVQRLGKLLQADYLVFGAVTEYKSENREVRVNRIIPDAELERYENQYQAYLANCRTSQMMGAPCTTQVRSPQEYREADGATRQQFARVANVGLTAKLVEVKTSRIGWVGQTSLSDEKLQDGMKRIVEAMTKDFLTNEKYADRTTK